MANWLKIDISSPVLQDLSSWSFRQFVQTVEGQFQVELGRKLFREDPVDGVAVREPLVDPIRVLSSSPEDVDGDWDDPVHGVASSNARYETMQEICRFVKCVDMSDRCQNLVRPFGFCCDICGILIDFTSDLTNMEKLKRKVGEFFEPRKYDGYALSVERTDDDEVIQTYQIAIVPTNITSYYDDLFFERVREELIVYLKSTAGTPLAFYRMTSTISTIDRSRRISDVILGSFLTFLVFATVIGAFVGREQWQNHDSAFYRFFHTPQFEAIVVRFHRDHDRVELLDTDNVEAPSSPVPQPPPVDKVFMKDFNYSFQSADAVTELVNPSYCPELVEEPEPISAPEKEEEGKTGEEELLVDFS